MSDDLSKTQEDFLRGHTVGDGYKAILATEARTMKSLASKGLIRYGHYNARFNSRPRTTRLTERGRETLRRILKGQP
jgi:hypothetical protein